MDSGGDEVTFDGRRDERFETSWLVEIAIPGQGKLRVTARDVSLSGARLAIPENIELPETFAFRIVGKDFLVQARKIWRRGHFVGITVERTAPLPPPAKDAPKVRSLGREARQEPREEQRKESGSALGSRSIGMYRDRRAR